VLLPNDYSKKKSFSYSQRVEILVLKNAHRSDFNHMMGTSNFLIEMKKIRIEKPQSKEKL